SIGLVIQIHRQTSCGLEEARLAVVWHIELCATFVPSVSSRRGGRTSSDRGAEVGISSAFTAALSNRGERDDPCVATPTHPVRCVLVRRTHALRALPDAVAPC